MFDPVTSSSVPGGPTRTSLLTRRSSASSGCPSAARVDDRRRPRATGRLHCRVVARRAPASTDSASSSRERLEPAAHVRPDLDAPPLEREHDVEVPQRQRLNRKVQDARRMPQLAKPEDAMQAAACTPAPAGRRRSADCEARRVAAALGGARDGVLEQLAVSPERTLTGARAIQPARRPVRPERRTARCR